MNKVFGSRANQLRVSIHALSREFGKRLLRSGTCPRQARVHPRLDPRLDRFAKLPTFVRQDRLDVTRPVLSVPPTIVLRNSGFQQLDTTINQLLPPFESSRDSRSKIFKICISRR